MASRSARQLKRENGSDGTLAEWVAKYSDERTCEEAVLAAKHPGGWVCPRCGSAK